MLLALCLLTSMIDAVTIIHDVTTTTAEEQHLLVEGIKKMKTVPSLYDDSMNAWDYFVGMHRSAVLPSSEVHAAWMFFPWHRELVFRMNQELRRVAGEETPWFPYWDFTSVESTTSLLDMSYLGGSGLRENGYILQEGNFREGEWNLDPKLASLPGEIAHKALMRAKGNGLQVCRDGKDRSFFLDTYLNYPEVDKEESVGPFVFLPDDGPPDPSTIIFASPRHDNVDCTWVDLTCLRSYRNESTGDYLTCRHYAAELPRRSDYTRCVDAMLPYTTGELGLINHTNPWATTKDYYKSYLSNFRPCIEGVDPSDRFAMGLERIGASLHPPHGSTHTTMGGSMATPTSPNDPIFVHLHFNVDRMWAEYQVKYGDGWFTEGPGKEYLNRTLPLFTNPSVTVGATLDFEGHYGYSYDTLQPEVIPDDHHEHHGICNEEEHIMMQELIEKPMTTEVMAGGLIFFSVCFESLLHLIEHSLHHNKYLLKALQQLYKELMILGAISFLFVVLNFFEWVEKAVDLVFHQGFEPEVFEITHIMLFVIMATYITICAFFMALASKLSRDWAYLEAHDKLEVRYAAAECHEGLSRTSWSNCLFKRPYYNIRLYFLSRKLDYYRLRTIFVRQNRLPYNFDFARYLRFCMRDLVVEFIHIPVSLWILFFLLLLINLIRVKVFGAEVDLGDNVVPFYVAFGYLPVLLGIVVFVKMRGIESKLVTSQAKETEIKGLVTPASSDLLGSYDTSTKRGCCSCYSNYKNASAHSRLFFLRSETFTLRIIQLLILFQSFYVAAFIMGFAKIITCYVGDYNLLVSVIAMAIAIIPIFLVLFIFTPLVLPLFTLATSVGNKVRTGVLEEMRGSPEHEDSDGGNIQQEYSSVGEHRMPHAITVDTDHDHTLASVDTLGNTTRDDLETPLEAGSHAPGESEDMPVDYALLKD